MKKLLLPVLAVSAMVLGSCSTQQLAQQSNDDVYFTEAKAKEVTFAVREERKEEKNYRTDEQLYGGGDYAEDRYDDYNYDYGYASRISRFYGRSSWRSAYYDSWYAYSYNPWYTYRYDPFFYDPWYYRSGVNVWVGIGSYPRYGMYDNWGFYGSPYASNYWGPYSYYNTYPGVGYGNGGYYGGGYYSGGRRNNSVNYRPRPDMGSGNPNSNYGTRGNNSGTTVIDRPTRGPRPTRPESGESRPTTSSTPYERSERVSRPTREESRPTYQEPTRPSSSGTTSSSPSGGSSGSSGGSSSGGGSRGERPTRGN